MMIVNVVGVTGPQDFPFGTLGGKWRFAVSSSDPLIGPQTIDSDTADATFQLAASDYVATFQRLDVNGAPLGPMPSQAFKVEAPATVSIDVAKGINVNITAG